MTSISSFNLSTAFSLDWKQSRFGEVFRELNERNGDERVGGPLSVSEYRGVVPRSMDASQAESADVSSYRVVRPGQLAANMMWLNRSGLGVSNLLGYVSPAYKVFDIDPSLLPEFANYALRSSLFRAYFESVGRGVRPNAQMVDTGDLKSMPFPTPELAEQRAIVDYLDRETAQIDELVAEQQRLIDLLLVRRKAVIESTVGRGLDTGSPMKPSGLFWTKEVPSHWTVANIRKFARMKTGHTPSRSKPEYWVDCTIPWFTLADVWQLRDGKRTFLGETKNLISDVGLENSAAELLPAGTVVLSRTASVGFSGVMPTDMATSQDFWNWIPSENLDSLYLMWVFRAMQSEFQSLMIGSTHKTIYQPTAAALRIPIPPLDEQLQISAYLNEQTEKIDTLIAEAERFIELAQERRSALITFAVTGQIDVRRTA